MGVACGGSCGRQTPRGGLVIYLRYAPQLGVRFHLDPQKSIVHEDSRSVCELAESRCGDKTRLQQARAWPGTLGRTCAVCDRPACSQLHLAGASHCSPPAAGGPGYRRPHPRSLLQAPTQPFMQVAPGCPRSVRTQRSAYARRGAVPGPVTLGCGRGARDHCSQAPRSGLGRSRSSVSKYRSCPSP